MAKRRQGVRRTTIEAFLARDEGTDTRHELEGRVPVATSPPLTRHLRIVADLTVELERHRDDRRPCRMVPGPGVAVDGTEGTFYIPDLVVTCEEPRLAVEILPPSAERLDRTLKVPAYGRLPGVQKIRPVSAGRRRVLVRRRAEGSWIARLYDLAGV